MMEGTFSRSSLAEQLACVAGVQRGGRGKVKFERDVRREREAIWEIWEIPTIALRTLLALRARIQLPPLSSWYAGHAGYRTVSKTAQDDNKEV